MVADNLKKNKIKEINQILQKNFTNLETDLDQVYGRCFFGSEGRRLAVGMYYMIELNELCRVFNPELMHEKHI